MSHIISFVKNQVATFFDVDLYHFQAINSRLVTITKCSHSCIQVTIDITLHKVHQGNHGEKKWLTYTGASTLAVISLCRKTEISFWKKKIKLLAKVTKGQG